MKSNKKRIVLVLAILTMAIVLSCALVACDKTDSQKPSNMISGTVDKKAMIKSIQNGTVDGLIVSLEIDNMVEDVDLSGMITTSKYCSWQLYTSKIATAADAIVTKIVVPENGNNIYYIVVTSADGKTNRTYTLNVWKNYYATLSFYANGSFYTSEQVLTHTTYGNGPSCSVDGYAFNGWGCDGYYVTESKSFNANLTPLTYTAKFDANGGRTLSDKTATFNKDLSLPTPSRTGYTFLGWYLNDNLYSDSIKYTFTNDVTFTARWQINSYNIVIKSDNEELGTVQAYNGKKDYNSSVSLSATTNPGSIFIGWFANGTKISSELSINVNVPDYDVTYTAKWITVDEYIKNYKLRQTANGYIITDVIDKTVSNVIIPDVIVGIGRSAFSGCTGLTSITIPDSVTSIGDSAFERCSGLTSVTIGNGVTSIGSSAFFGCTGLTNITIPDSVTSIGSSAFYNTAWYNNQPDGLVYAGKVAYKYKGTMPSNTSIVLKEGTLGIAGSAFAYCTGLTSVTIGNSVTSIDSSAFYNCTGLTSVTIGNSVTSIGYEAFRGCDNLQDIYVTDIAAWCNISGLDNLMGYGSNNKKLYINNELATSITIPDGVTEIPSYAFRGCTGLTSVTIPASVTSIGDYAFGGCYKLIEVYNKSALSITAGSSSNGYVAYYAKNVYTNEEGSKLTTDENGYVIYTDGDEKILIAYQGTNTELVLPSYITKINQNAFRGCTGLTNVTIPDSVTKIGDSAFDGCNLTAVTIGNSVTSIGNYAFYNCTGLTSITFNGTIAQWNAIFKGSYWKNSVPATQVICTDMTIFI